MNPGTLRLFQVALAIFLGVFPTLRAASLDFEVVDKVGWKGGHIGGEKVVETYSYDASTDTVTVRVQLDAKARLAPVPPMLALAVAQGFPVKFDRSLVTTDSNCVFGPIVTIADTDVYTYQIAGLDRYVGERRAVGDGPAPEALQRELNGEVEKILAAGHLAPWHFLVNVPGSGANDRGDVYWDNSAETLYLLAEIAPLLPAELRMGVVDYLANERKSYPPEKLRSVPFTEGNRREYVSTDDKLRQLWQDRVLASRTQGPLGVWNLYGLARYYELTGGRPEPEVMEACHRIAREALLHRDWATLYWQRGHTPAFNAVHGANQLFAGFIGYIRLARLAGDRDAEVMGWGMLARTAALRFAMGRHAQFLHATHQFNVDYGYLSGSGEVNPESFAIRVETDPQKYVLPQDPGWWTKKRQGNWIGDLVTWHWSRPIDNVRQVHRLDETGVDLWEWAGVDCNGTGQKRDVESKRSSYWYNRLTPHLLPFRDLVPESGRFLQDHLRPETQAYCERVAENQPHWYATYAEAILSAETGFAAPSDAHGQFVARAWILDEKPEQLARWIDVPYLKVGDLYYVQKLAEAVRAYRDGRWERR